MFMLLYLFIYLFLFILELFVLILQLLAVLISLSLLLLHILRVLELLHQCNLKYWMVPDHFRLLFFMHKICLNHPSGVRPFVSSSISWGFFCLFFFVFLSICLNSSLTHFKNGPENLSIYSFDEIPATERVFLFFWSTLFLSFFFSITIRLIVSATV